MYQISLKIHSKIFLKKNNLCLVTYPELKEKGVIFKSDKKQKVTKINPIQKIKQYKIITLIQIKI